MRDSADTERKLRGHYTEVYTHFDNIDEIDYSKTTNHLNSSKMKQKTGIIL